LGSSAFFPVWWESTYTGISLGQHDKEQKNLLRNYLPDHTDARNFWLDLYALRNHPRLDERGLAFSKVRDASLPEKEI
jgi:hypothetical protein